MPASRRSLCTRHRSPLSAKPGRLGFRSSGL
jgi:hypothetical protein